MGEKQPSLVIMVTVVQEFPTITRGVVVVSVTVKVSSASNISSSVIVMSIHCVLPVMEPAGNIREEDTDS